MTTVFKAFLTMIFLAVFTHASTAQEAAAQQPQQSEQKKSRLDGIEKMYDFTKAQVKVLDSIKNKEIDVVNIAAQSIKKIHIKDQLYITQQFVPIEAQIVVDSLSGHNEVVSYRSITLVVSEKHEKGSYKTYFDKLKALKLKEAARLREQADKIEKQQENE